MNDQMTLDINLDDLTIDEVIDFETITGYPIEMSVMVGAKRGIAAKALVFIAMKRTNPNVTLEDVGKVKFASIVPKQSTEAMDPTGPGAP